MTCKTRSLRFAPPGPAIGSSFLKTVLSEYNGDQILQPPLTENVKTGDQEEDRRINSTHFMISP
ncbi:MAG: hypothetical protein L3J49_08875 [Desulfobulbaceae bacterium]|nr:hypothetical protein [Desulfobulbaceae bacterium]